MTVLKAETRAIAGKKVNQLRQAGKIPAVLYGHNVKSQNLSIDAKEFNKTFKQIGETSVLELTVGEKKHNVLVHDLDRHPLSHEVQHVDFYAVRMDEKIKVKAPLVFVGESPAVKNEGGVLVKALHEVEVEALPKDLPKEIEVDISLLATFENKIHVSDLKLGSGVKVLLEGQEMVASVTPPRSEAELKELEAAPVAEVGEVKVVGEEEKKAEAAEATSEEAPAEKKE